MSGCERGAGGHAPSGEISDRDLRAATIDALMREFARYIDRRLQAELGERLPVAIFVFDEDQAHAAVSGDWEGIRRVLADWAEDPREPGGTFSLAGN